MQQAKTARSFQEIGLQPVIIGVVRPHAGHHNDVISPRKLRLMQAIDLTQTAADAVANHSMSDFIGHGIADPVPDGTVFAAIQRQTCGRSTLSFGIQAPEFIVLF